MPVGMRAFPIGMQQRPDIVNNSDDRTVAATWEIPKVRREDQIVVFVACVKRDFLNEITESLGLL